MTTAAGCNLPGCRCGGTYVHFCPDCFASPCWCADREAAKAKASPVPDAKAGLDKPSLDESLRDDLAALKATAEHAVARLQEAMREADRLRGVERAAGQVREAWQCPMYFSGGSEEEVSCLTRGRHPLCVRCVTVTALASPPPSLSTGVGGGQAAADPEPMRCQAVNGAPDWDKLRLRCVLWRGHTDVHRAPCDLSLNDSGETWWDDRWTVKAVPPPVAPPASGEGDDSCPVCHTDGVRAHCFCMNSTPEWRAQKRAERRAEDRALFDAAMKDRAPTAAQSVEAPAVSICPRCMANGTIPAYNAPHAHWINCPDCAGSGRIPPPAPPSPSAEVGEVSCRHGVPVRRGCYQCVDDEPRRNAEVSSTPSPSGRGEDPHCTCTDPGSDPTCPVFADHRRWQSENQCTHGVRLTDRCEACAAKVSPPACPAIEEPSSTPAASYDPAAEKLRAESTCPAVEPGTGHACAGDTDLADAMRCAEGFHLCSAGCDVGWSTPPASNARHDLAGRALGEGDDCPPGPKPAAAFYLPEARRTFAATPPATTTGAKCDKPGHTGVTCRECAENLADAYRDEIDAGNVEHTAALSTACAAERAEVLGRVACSIAEERKEWLQGYGANQVLDELGKRLAATFGAAWPAGEGK